MARERLFRAGKVVRVMMAVPLGKHFYGHAEVARRLPNIGGSLHQPRRGGVAKNMGSHIVSKSGISRDVGERFGDALYGLTIPFHGKTLPLTFPAP